MLRVIALYVILHDFALLLEAVVGEDGVFFGLVIINPFAIPEVFQRGFRPEIVQVLELPHVAGFMGQQRQQVLFGVLREIVGVVSFPEADRVIDHHRAGRDSEKQPLLDFHQVVVDGIVVNRLEELSFAGCEGAIVAKQEAFEEGFCSASFFAGIGWFH